MAGNSGLGRQLERVRSKFTKELDINKLLPRLLVRRVLTVSEEKEILSPSVPQKRVEALLDILSVKDRSVFYEFCRSLEECAPHLLTVLVLDSHQGLDQENVSETHIKDKDPLPLDSVDTKKHGNLTQQDLEQLHTETNHKMISSENLSGKENILELNSSFPPYTSSMKIKDRLFSVETDQVYEENGPNVVWETCHVSLQKVPTFGFGIAVSGGYDSPHFANGDPSVAISDVLKSGPAEGKLQINDRIVTVNGVSLENVNHNMAISVLRESGSTVNLVVRRRILLPASEAKTSSPPLRITLTKKNKKDEFGILLGCKVFIKEIAHNSLASHESALHEGDTVLKINETSVENLSLTEVKRLLDRGKDKLQLIVRTVGTGDMVNISQMSIPDALNDIGLVPTQVRDSDNVNIFRPNKRLEEDIYVKDPTSRVRHVVPLGAHPKSENTTYDAHLVLDNEPPSWATLPRSTEPKVSKKHDEIEQLQHDLHDGYYSDQDDGWRGQGAFVPIQRPTNHVFSNRSIHDLDPRRVTFYKDRQTGLGLRLAGGNATGIFIASVQPGSAGERVGLVEGNKIILANDRDMTGIIREEAVSYLTNLEGQVTMVVHYRKEDYDRIMSSHEAGDSFYIRTHFKHTASDTETEHSFKIGDIFHVKDTLFRGIGGSWLAIRVSEGVKQKQKGTIPNSKTAEILKSQQIEDSDKENFPNRGRGSLFRRKSSSRRSKSLGKDHWEQLIFEGSGSSRTIIACFLPALFTFDTFTAGLGTKFPPYERVVYRDPGFIRPVVLFGAISDIARERLFAEFPNRFDSPQAQKSTDPVDKKEKSVVVTVGSLRDAIAQRKHCLLDITPLNVDRLNYSQYNPIVIFLKAETKQAIKDVRARWKTTTKSHRKLLEQSERVEKTYSHLFTGQLKYMGTDSWFPKLCEMIESQQRHKIWMSEKQPVEDMSDDLMFPMSSRMSCTTGTSSHVDIAQLQSELDISNMGVQQASKFSSVPSVNMLDNFPGMPSYSLTTTYKNQRSDTIKWTTFETPSHDLRNSISDISHRSPPRDDGQAHPEDRYYPSYYSDHRTSDFSNSRANIDPHATLTQAEQLLTTLQTGGSLEFGSYQEKKEEEDKSSEDNGGKQGAAVTNGAQQKETIDGRAGEHGGYTDNSTQVSDSYSKYVISPQNKHDDTKLQEKFGGIQNTGRENSPGYDSNRYTHGTVHLTGGNVDKAKLSDLSARYRRQDSLLQFGGGRHTTAPTSQQPDKQPASVIPIRAYSVKHRGLETDELKMPESESFIRPYKNSASSHYRTPIATTTPPSYPSGLIMDKPPEYTPLHQAHNTASYSGDSSNNRLNFTSQKIPAQTASSPYQHSLGQHKPQQQFHMWGRGPSLDSALSAPHLSDQDVQDSKAYANEVYMNQFDMKKARQAKLLPGAALGGVGYPAQAAQGVRDGRGEGMQGRIPTLERGYSRPR